MPNHGPLDLSIPIIPSIPTIAPKSHKCPFTCAAISKWEHTNAGGRLTVWNSSLSRHRGSNSDGR